MIDLVSVITPAYKAANYIDKAITSVRSQTYSHWELIVANDGSSDETERIVTRHMKDDKRVKLVQHLKRQGPAMARNSCLHEAQGRFIAFLDSDDWWLPRKLELQLGYMQRANSALTYTQFRRVDESGNNEGHLIKVPTELTYLELLGNTAIATSTAMVDRKQTGPFCMKDTHTDDLALWLQLLRGGRTASALHEDLMRYRVLDGSWSRNKINNAIKVWGLYRDIEGLNMMRSSIFFSRYVCNALIKHARF
jgi:teichuronic acid biosynthesis glycosyltransferase TuaG